MTRNRSADPEHADAVEQPGGVAGPETVPLLARDRVGCATRLRHGLADAVLSQSRTVGIITRRDLLLAARLLEIPGAGSLSHGDLVGAIRKALHSSGHPDAIERELRFLVEALRLAGRATAANDLLTTLRSAA